MAKVKLDIAEIVGNTKQWVYQSDTQIGQTISYLKKEDILPMRAAIELALKIVFHPSALQSLGASPDQIEASILRSKKAMTYYLDQQASVPLDDLTTDTRSPLEGSGDLDLQQSGGSDDWDQGNDWTELNDDDALMLETPPQPLNVKSMTVFSKNDDVF